MKESKDWSEEVEEPECSNKDMSVEETKKETKSEIKEFLSVKESKDWSKCKNYYRPQTGHLARFPNLSIQGSNLSSKDLRHYLYL